MQIAEAEDQHPETHINHNIRLQDRTASVQFSYEL